MALRSHGVASAFGAVLFGSLAIGAAGPVRAAEWTGDPEHHATLREVISSAHHPWLHWPEFPWYRDEMVGLYGENADSLVWMRGGKPIPQAAVVIAELGRAGERGLEPVDYDVELLERNNTALEKGVELTPREVALHDLALSLLYMRHVSDLHIGRVNPRNLGIGIDVEAKKYHVPTLVRRAIAENRMAEVVAEAEPPLVQYREMKRLLEAYRSLAAGERFDPLPRVKKLEPGQSYSGVDALRQRLVFLGDLAREDSAAVGAAARYDSTLVAAVKRFQGRHGLNADGVIGKGTLAALDVPLQRRVTQLQLALERLRWLPDLSARDFIVVNVPGFELYAFDAANTGAPELRMPVIVGKSLDTQTPVFQEEMRYIIFRPYWNVPSSITKDELIPKLRKDPSYLQTEDMEIVGGFADETPALQVNEETLDRLARGALRIRQRPGPKNALGLIKFIFPNNNNVYLHSTPSPSLFARQRRDFSHGCIRVEDPVALAHWVLRDKPEWTHETIATAMGAEESSRVNLSEPLLVLIFYTTAIVNPDGTASFYEDVYGHDARLEAALLRGEPFEP